MNSNFNFKISLISLLITTSLMLPLDVLGKPETNPGLEKKATIGEVEKINGSTVTIKDKKQNEASSVIIDDTAKVVGKNNKQLKLNSLKPKDKVALISTDSATATTGGKVKKITKVYVKSATTSAQSKRQAIQGVITAISGNDITLAHQVQRDRTYKLSTTTQTVIKMKGVQEASTSALAVGQRIAAVGNLNEAGVLVAQRIHIIPGKAIGLFKKNPLNSSGSATPSATVSTTVTPTSTVSATPTDTLTPTVTSVPTNTPTPTTTETTSTPTPTL